MKKTYEDAEKLFLEYNHTDSLQKHGYTVEEVMKHFARLNNEDEDKWAIVGLLHDLDYEQFPDEHCIKSREILEKEGFDEEIIRAIVSHGYGYKDNDTKPESLMEKTLYTIDELSGLITANALMRPTKMEGMNVKSVKKKFKDKSFAAGVDREIIKNGAEMLGTPLEDIIKECIIAMQNSAEKLGLSN